MFEKIKRYFIDLKYKSTTLYNCDYDFYDEPIFLIDLEGLDV